MNPTIASHPHLVDAFGNALAIYDRGTFEHSTRVGMLARQIGEVAGLEPATLEALGWAGALHDMGKLAVSEHILHKRGRLTANDWAEIKVHPVVGADLILVISPALSPVADAVRSHHERWDGKGYPDGLDGEDIPLLGRIIALADVYDSLTRDRPYRARVFSPFEAQRMIESWSGTHFDPALVPTFSDVRRSRKN